MKLSDDDIIHALQALDGWAYDAAQRRIEKHYDFKNFQQALQFVSKLGEIAESANHHPDIEFGWGYLRLYFTTHDASAVTERDIAMAKRVENL